MLRAPRMLHLASVLAAALPLAAGGCCPRKPHGSSDGGTGGGCNGGLCGVDGIGEASPLNFGSVLVGQTSAPLKLVLKNAGDGPLTLGDATIGGTNPGDFRLVTKFPASVAQGMSASVPVLFIPTVGGPRTATVNIPTDSLETPTVVVTLTGTGVQLDLCSHPSAVDFGNVQVLGTPSVQKISLGNCGPTQFTLTVGPITGPQAGDFSLSGQTSLTLAPNQNASVSVAYSPAAMGPSSASLPLSVTLQGCNNCSAPAITLSGVGVDGQLVFSPSPVNFGPVPSGSSPSQKVTATNVGTEPLQITQLGTYNGNAIFSLSGQPALPVTLAPSGGSTSFTVTYSPATQGGDQDQILAVWTVADPAVSPRQASDQLSGNQILGPCSLQIAPTAVNFGNVTPGSSAQKDVTVTNAGGTACNVASIALGPSTDPGFALASGQPVAFVVQPGSNATIGVTFSPASAATPLLRRGTLTFQTGDTSNPSASVPLSAFIDNSNIYSGGWPKWHLDNFNSGQSGADTSGLQGTVKWKYNIGKPGGAAGIFGFGTTYINSPVVDGNGNVYQVSMPGTGSSILYALSPAGTVNWQQTISDASGDPHPSTPAILKDGSMFVISGSDGSPPNLYYLANTGAVVFSESFGEDGFDACPGLGSDGTLFEADDDGPASSGGSGDPYSAIAFQASGRTVTQISGLALPISVESERFGVVIASDNTSYWGNNGQFFAVSPPSKGFTTVAGWPSSGVTAASNANDSNATGAVISDLALDNQTTGYLYAYSAWEDSVGSGYSVQGNLTALDPSNGQTKWTLTLPSTALPAGWNPLQSDAGNAAPAIASDGTVYVGNGDGLRAVDGASGNVKWLFKSANVSDSPAIGADGTIFFGCSDGNFYAVTAAGQLRFKVQTAGPISDSPAIGSDGTVVFTSDDGNVYALQ